MRLELFLDPSCSLIEFKTDFLGAAAADFSFSRVDLRDDGGADDLRRLLAGSPDEDTRRLVDEAAESGLTDERRGGIGVLMYMWWFLEWALGI